MSPFTIAMLILAIILNALANILIKASSLYSQDNSLIGLIYNFWLWGGLICFGLALVFYRYVLSKGLALSIAYPIMTTAGFAIVILASSIFFHERLVTIQWVGIGCLVLGIWLIASKI